MRSRDVWGWREVGGSARVTDDELTGVTTVDNGLTDVATQVRATDHCVHRIAYGSYCRPGTSMILRGAADGPSIDVALQRASFSETTWKADHGQ